MITLVAAVIAAFASVVSVAINIAFQKQSAERAAQLRLAEVRMQWADELATNFAKFVGLFAELMYAGDDLDEVRRQSAPERNYYRFKLSLMLNPEIPDHARLREIINELAPMGRHYQPSMFEKCNNFIIESVPIIKRASDEARHSALSVIGGGK